MAWRDGGAYRGSAAIRARLGTFFDTERPGQTLTTSDLAEDDRWPAWAAEVTVQVHELEEVDRYRRASVDALQQLDWCIGYLHGCGKTGLVRELATNRAQ